VAPDMPLFGYFFNRVVQKLQFLNNNRLKTAKNADFIKNMRFLEDL
jgi:hypothetical protein